MNKSKLINLLSTLTKEEWGGVKKYLLTKTRKESENIKVFLNLEKKREKLKDLDLDKFIERHYPKSTKKAIQNIMSKLLAWTEECLAVQSFLNDENKIKAAIIIENNKRGLYEEATRLTKKILVSLEEPTITLEDQKIKAELLHTLYYSDNPLKIDQSFDLFYKMIDATLGEARNKVNLYQIELLNYRDIMKKDISEDKAYLMRLSDSINTNENSDLLRRMLKVVDYQGVDEFENILNILVRRGIHTNDTLSHICIMYMYNYMARYWIKGLLEDVKLLPRYIDLGMTNGSFMQQNGIPFLRFQNLTTSLAAITNYEVTADFINKWYTKIQSKNVDGARRIAFGINAFYNERYDEMIPLLRGVKTENLYQKTKVYALELIALFKSKDMDYNLFYIKANNFKRFLRNNRDKINTKDHDANANFVKVLEKIIDVNSRLQVEDLNEIKALLFRKWLINELSNRKR